MKNIWKNADRLEKLGLVIISICAGAVIAGTVSLVLIYLHLKH